jgi:hypothetical protein
MANPSGAVMEAPKDRFSAADRPTIEKLKSVDHVRDLIGPDSTVMVANLGALGEASADPNSAKTFLAFRIEDSSCFACPTAVFKDEVDSRNFQGMMFSTRFFTFGDVLTSVCEKCGNSRSILFYEGKEIVEVIFIHDTRIVF